MAISSLAMLKIMACNHNSGKENRIRQEHCEARMLTISAALVILAVPKPWGIKSVHRWNSDVLKFHKKTDTLEIIPSNADTKVKECSLRVLRIIL